jgi:fatty acid-binding protein DegV
VEVAPLHRFPEETSSTRSPGRIYNRLESMCPAPTTSQPSAGHFAGCIASWPMKDEILSIHISSGLSGTLEQPGWAQPCAAYPAALAKSTVTA